MKDPKDNQTIDAFEKKAMTGAERQAKLRATRAGKARIDCYIGEEHKAKLDEMRQGKSISEYLEKLIDNDYDEEWLNINNLKKDALQGNKEEIKQDPRFAPKIRRRLSKEELEEFRKNRIDRSA